MRLSQADRRRGFRDEDAQGLAYFRQVARDQGMSSGDLYRAESRYLSEHRQWRTEADREGFIRQTVSGLGFDQAFSDALWDETATIAETQQFPDIREAVPTPAEDLRRLDEIGDIMRSDPHKYNKLELGDEATDIRRRLGPEAGMSRPAPTPDAPARTNRLDELRGLMKDPHSAYHRGPKSDAIQAEYRDLLSGDSAGDTNTIKTGTADGSSPA